MLSLHAVARMPAVAGTMLTPVALSAPAQSLDVVPNTTPTVETRTEVSDACPAAIEAYNDTVSATEGLPAARGGGAASNPARTRMGLKVTTPGFPITWNEEHFVSLHANGTYDW